MSKVTDLELGKAAEHLVCADLILKGYRTYLTDQGLPYDVVVDLDGNLVRIQVKATSKHRAVPQRATHMPAYMWHVRRAGKGHRRLYSEKEFDLLALVATDIKAIAYFRIDKSVKQTIHLRPPGSPTKINQRVLRNIDEYPFEDAIGGLVDIAWRLR